MTSRGTAGQPGLGLAPAWAEQIPDFPGSVALSSGPLVLLHTEIMRRRLLVTKLGHNLSRRLLAWAIVYRYSNLAAWLRRLPQPSQPALGALAERWFGTEEPPGRAFPGVPGLVPGLCGLSIGHPCRNPVARSPAGAEPGPVAVRLVRSARLWAGVPYAYASVGNPGALVFTAGACPLSPDGDVVGAGDVRAQTEQCVSNLAEALAAAGSGLSHVLKTTIYVASDDRADLVTAWEVVSSAFGDHDVPSTLLGVTVLGYPGQLVEIEAVGLPAAGS